MLASLAGLALRGYITHKVLSLKIPGKDYSATINGEWDEAFSPNGDGGGTIYWSNGGHTSVDSSGKDKRGRQFTIAYN